MYLPCSKTEGKMDKRDGAVDAVEEEIPGG
jgi:hypothetical protein